MESENLSPEQANSTASKNHDEKVRRNDLDALRAGAMLLGICLHAMLAYTRAAWIVMDNHQWEAFEHVSSFIHGFRMPLFFLVSGFFTAMLAQRHGPFGMLKNRAARILLPLAICLLTIIPLDKVVEFFAASANASHPQDLMFKTIQRGNPDEVLQLLKSEPNVLLEQIEKRLKMTPLVWAVFCESEPITRLLLEHGANPMAFNRLGYNSLSAAALLGREDLLKLLIEKGGDPFEAKGREKSAWMAAHQSLEDAQAIIWLSKGKFPENKGELEHGRNSVKEYLEQYSREKKITPNLPEQATVPNSVEVLPGWLKAYFAWLSSEGNTVKISGLEINLLQENFLEHLWFLWFLWWLCLIYAGLSWCMRLTRLSAPKRLAFIYPGLLVAFICTVCMQATMNLDYYPKILNVRVGPDLSTGLVPKPHVILYYSVFFLFGCWYFGLDDAECRLGRYWRIGLPFAVVVYPLVLLTTGKWLPNSLLQSLFTWLMCLGAIGLSHSLFQRESKLFRYVADASYWLYLTHLSVVLFMQWMVFFLPVPAIVKFLLVLLVTLSVLFVSYEYLVRYTVIGKILNGKRFVKSKFSDS